MIVIREVFQDRSYLRTSIRSMGFATPMGFCTPLTSETCSLGPSAVSLAALQEAWPALRPMAMSASQAPRNGRSLYKEA